MIDNSLRIGIGQTMLMVAKEFCRGRENYEYARGQAELLIDCSPRWNMDDKEALIEYLLEDY